MHPYMIYQTVANTRIASMHVCAFFHLVYALSFPSPLRSIPPFRSSLALNCAVGRGGQAWSQKCKCAAWLMSHSEAASPPTVCKYVVTLIERSSTSQQLSFLLGVCVCACLYLCEYGHSWSTRRHMAVMHTAVQKSHIHKITFNRGKEVHLRAGADPLTHARAHV